nr:hypothetical protein [Cryptomonas tetrapyrenoidosa]
MKFLNRYRLLNFVLYTAILYQFFKVLWIEYKFDPKTYEPYLRKETPSEKNLSIEKKILVDLKYKKEVYFGERDLQDTLSIILDAEHKVVGCRFSNSHESLAEHFYLNKKFLNSTLIGSIRLIEL